MHKIYNGNLVGFMVILAVILSMVQMAIKSSHLLITLPLILLLIAGFGFDFKAASRLTLSLEDDPLTPERRDTIRRKIGNMALYSIALALFAFVIGITVAGGMPHSLLASLSR